MLLIPFVLNYMAGWYAWYQVDKRKKYTWPACLLGLYPQLRAANIIRELWRNPMRGLAKKRKFEREISQAGVFLESVPTTYIMSYIIARIIGRNTSTINRRAFSGFTGARGSSLKLFKISYYTSFISASIGMGKVLKVII